RVGRPSALVVHYAQRVRALADLIADRFDEVRPVHPEEPRGAEDDELARVRGRLLAQAFRTAVGGERGGRRVDLVRLARRAVEDEVGRELHQQRVHVVRGLREELHRGAVDGVRHALVLFRGVDLRVRGAVDDDRWTSVAYDLVHQTRVADV